MYKNVIWALLIIAAFASCSNTETLNRKANFNKGWKFTLESADKAYENNYNDTDWKTVDVPHDWSVEFPFDSIKGEGCTGYLPGGIGWYRKHFTVDIDTNQDVYILFDGVYNNSEYWLNGVKIGEHPYGYSPFYFKLNAHLKTNGEKNILTVKVDRSRYADSRWYSGSGIYRNVELITVNKLHTAIWGTYITTPKVSSEEADINIQLTLNNNYTESKSFRVVNRIINRDGQTEKELKSEEITIQTGDSVLNFNTTLANPKLWSLDDPHLYKMISEIYINDEVIDTYETTFGVRSIHFDAKTGFFLNGKNHKIKGVCLHHDGGLVGAAVPKDVWKRRLAILQEGGCNAVRISHNPASTEFLELCDEMGILVQDEFFDEWDYPKDKRLNQWEQHDDYISRGYAEKFQEWAYTDLKNTMLSHRNHPSIFQWSIGNEIEWTYPRNRKATGFFDNMNWDGNYFWSPSPYSPEKIKAEYNKAEALEYNIESTAKKLADWTRNIDDTRPVIANCILPSASFETGYADALDIVGFSYRRVIYDYAREHYPDKLIMGTESLPQWHEWKAIEERPFVSGTFLWTGIDYMGEANGQWPKKGIESGLLDLAGFKKASYYMYKTLWTNTPALYISSQNVEKSRYKIEDGIVKERTEGAWENALWEWSKTNEHWNYVEGEQVIVEIISNADEVELFLNEQSLGKKKLSDFPDRIYKWAVPFTKGTLKAVGSTNQLTTEITSATEPVGIAIDIDKQKLNIDNNDVAHLVIQLIDSNGNPVKHIDKEVTFEFSEAITNLGVDNGDIRSTQAFQNNIIKTVNGRALCIVKGNKASAKAEITVSGEGLKAASTDLELR